MRRRRITRFSVVRTASVMSLVYALAGALVLLPSALIGVVVIPEAPAGAFGSLEFLRAAVLSPMLYAFIGWPVTALVLIAYNIAARWLGGIEYETQAADAAVDVTVPDEEPGGDQARG